MRTRWKRKQNSRLGWFQSLFPSQWSQAALPGPESKKDSVVLEACVNIPKTLVVKRLMTRQTSFYCTWQILWFLPIKDLWQPWVQHVSWSHFSNSICSLCVFVSHFDNSCNISNFIIIMFVMVICDQWSLMWLLITTQWRLRWWFSVF